MAVITISHTLNNCSIRPPTYSVHHFSSKFTSTLVIKPPIQTTAWDWIIPKT